ncbi:MAG: hypothetical protein ACIAQ0_14710 [Phycisphaerales bacterium JB058]
MSRTDLNDVVRYRLLVTGALRLMGIWLIASRILPLVTQALMIWSQDQSQPNFAGTRTGLFGSSPWLWGNLIQGLTFLAGGVLLIAYARRMARRIIPIGTDRCPGCDYDLGATPPARCPECGLDLASLRPAHVQSPGADSQ